MITICRTGCGQRVLTRAAWPCSAHENTPTHFEGLERPNGAFVAVGSTVAASGRGSAAVGWGSGTVGQASFQASFRRKALTHQDNSMKWNGGTVERWSRATRAHAGKDRARMCVRGNLSFHRSTVPESDIIKRSHGFAGGTMSGTVFRRSFQSRKISRLNTRAKL